MPRYGPVMVFRLGEWALVLAGGFLAGGLYFGGLWLTARRVLRARRPALFLMASYLVRTSLTVGLFYVFMAGSGPKLLVCLAGFLIMRQALTRILGPADKKTVADLPGGKTA